MTFSNRVSEALRSLNHLTTHIRLLVRPKEFPAQDKETDDDQAVAPMSTTCQQASTNREIY